MTTIQSTKTTHKTSTLSLFVDSAVLVLVALTLSGFDMFLGSAQSGVLPVKANLIAFGFIAASCFAVLWIELSTQRLDKIYRCVLLAGPILLLLSIFSMFRLTGSFLPDAYWDEGAIYIIFPVYELLLIVLAFLIGASTTFGRIAKLVFILAFCILLTGVVIDILAPGTFATFANRGAAWLENSNRASRALVALGLLSSWAVTSNKARIVISLLTLVAVFATLSRSGTVLFIGTFTLYFLIASLRSAVAFLVWFVAFIGLAVVIALTVDLTDILGERSYVFATVVQQRIEFFISLLVGDFASLQTESRVALLPKYFNLISDSPLLGHGLGAARTQPVPPHNIYVQLWTENGIFAVVLWITVLIVLSRFFLQVRSASGLALTAFVVAAGFVSHSLLGERSVYITLALIVGYSARRRLQSSLYLQPNARRAAGVSSRLHS